MSDRAVGLGTSRQGPERTTVIYEDGSVLENGPCMPGNKIDSITNTGNTSVVISSDVLGWPPAPHLTS